MSFGLVNDPHALFGRRCRLVVSDTSEKEIARTKTESTVEVTTNSTEIIGGDGGMRIGFDINKTLKKEPNTAEIRVYNLAATTRAGLQKKGVAALLEAGYQETGLSRIASGNVRTVDHVREGADWITIIKLGDGERAWQYGRVNESFSAGTRVADVIKKLAQQMGLGGDDIDKQLDAAKRSTKRRIPETLDHGWAASGSAGRAMDHIMKAAHLSWSVQDGQLQILVEGQALDNVVFRINPRSGLIGSPEMGTPPRKGGPGLIKFVSLLIPVKPGGKVELTSDRYDGEVRLVGVNLVGDTHGTEWYAKMAGEVLK